MVTLPRHSSAIASVVLIAFGAGALFLGIHVPASLEHRSHFAEQLGVLNVVTGLALVLTGAALGAVSARLLRGDG